MLHKSWTQFSPFALPGSPYPFPRPPPHLESSNIILLPSLPFLYQLYRHPPHSNSSFGASVCLVEQPSLAKDQSLPTFRPGPSSARSSLLALYSSHGRVHLHQKSLRFSHTLTSFPHLAHYAPYFLIIVPACTDRGFAYGLLDVLNAHFQKVLGITKLQSTGLQVAYFGLGYFCFAAVAGEVLRRKGYKFTIIMGLTLYSTGAICFWPCAKFSGRGNNGAVFAGFVVCTGVIACGLASLETAANSYITVLPGCKPEGAAFRLQFSQSFNGIASFAGPFIASKYFFSGENANNLTNVQWVYLAVACLGVFLIALFSFFDLPETSESELAEQSRVAALASNNMDRSSQPFYKQYRAIFGFVAQFFYVGAQVNVATFFINYIQSAVGWENHVASNFLSYSLIIFTVTRFIGLAASVFVNVEFMVGVCASICVVFSLLATLLTGKAGLAALMLIFAFESILFPCIFVISTTNMGQHTRRASALLIMGVGGGAVFPPPQGALADRYGTHHSYALVVPLYFYIACFAFFLWRHHGGGWRRKDDPIDPVEEASRGPADDGEDEKGMSEIKHYERSPLA